MHIPRYIKVKKRIWQVRYSKSLLAINKCVGLCDPNTRNIFIYPRQSADMIEHTFIHELLHACFPENIVGADREEYIVTHLARRLNSCLKGNPKLMLTKGKRKPKLAYTQHKSNKKRVNDK
jgi:hypothetical protein